MCRAKTYSRKRSFEFFDFFFENSKFQNENELRGLFFTIATEFTGILEVSLGGILLSSWLLQQWGYYSTIRPVLT